MVLAVLAVLVVALDRPCSRRHLLSLFMRCSPAVRYGETRFEGERHGLLSALCLQYLHQRRLLRVSRDLSCRVVSDGLHTALVSHEVKLTF